MYFAADYALIAADPLAFLESLKQRLAALSIATGQLTFAVSPGSIHVRIFGPPPVLQAIAQALAARTLTVPLNGADVTATATTTETGGSVASSGTSLTAGVVVAIVLLSVLCLVSTLVLVCSMCRRRQSRGYSPHAQEQKHQQQSQPHLQPVEPMLLHIASPTPASPPTDMTEYWADDDLNNGGAGSRLGAKPGAPPLPPLSSPLRSVVGSTAAATADRPLSSTSQHLRPSERARAFDESLADAAEPHLYDNPRFAAVPSLKTVAKTVPPAPGVQYYVVDEIPGDPTGYEWYHVPVTAESSASSSHGGSERDADSVAEDAAGGGGGGGAGEQLAVAPRHVADWDLDL